MSEPTVGERLAVLEDRNKRQSKDIKEILDVVKDTSASIISCTVKVDALDEADLNGRLTKVETRQKIYMSIATALITAGGAVSMWRDKILSFF